jgi:glyoxylase-like metal-dependent hydrolase (beta-lactamase superfamily II)
VEFHFFGWAHTRGDGFVFLPKEKVICTGDALANGGFNYLGLGHIRNWNNVLAKAQALGAQHVLPGHGRPAGPEVFAGQMLFFTELQKAVQQQINQGKQLKDLVYTNPHPNPDGRFGNLTTNIKLPDSVKHWISEDRLPRQVSDTYEELTQGKPHGEIMGGK